MNWLEGFQKPGQQWERSLLESETNVGLLDLSLNPKWAKCLQFPSVLPFPLTALEFFDEMFNYEIHPCSTSQDFCKQLFTVGQICLISPIYCSPFSDKLEKL